MMNLILDEYDTPIILESLRSLKASLLTNMCLNTRKTVLGGLRTTKAQASLRITWSNQRLCY